MEKSFDCQTRDQIGLILNSFDGTIVKNFLNKEKWPWSGGQVAQMSEAMSRFDQA